jgi:hypothetical protein
MTDEIGGGSVGKRFILYDHGHASFHRWREPEKGSVAKTICVTGGNHPFFLGVFYILIGEIR